MQKTPEYTNIQTNIQRIGDGYTLFGYADYDGKRHGWTLKAEGSVNPDDSHDAVLQRHESVILRHMQITQPTFHWSIPV